MINHPRISIKERLFVRRSRNAVVQFREIATDQDTSLAPSPDWKQSPGRKAESNASKVSATRPTAPEFSVDV